MKRLMEWVVPERIAPTSGDTLALLLEELAMWTAQYRHAADAQRTARAWETSDAFVYARQLTDHAERYVQ